MSCYFEPKPLTKKSRAALLKCLEKLDGVRQAQKDLRDAQQEERASTDLYEQAKGEFLKLIGFREGHILHHVYILPDGRLVELDGSRLFVRKGDPI